MEFPKTGKQCNVKYCKLLEFLPVKCAHCQLEFCKDHSDTTSHECTKYKDNFITEKKVSPSYKCNLAGCKSSDAVEMKCILCKKHFCLQHRHHGCLDTAPSTSKKEKQRASKEQFKQAKAETDKMVQDTLRNAKNRALANKIKLMKIKSSAVGDNQIPVKDRVFFLVAPPLRQNDDKSIARGFYVCKTWTLDGDSLILEYVNKENMENQRYEEMFDEARCSKYVFI
ncbi:AN1-type zinc finger protein 1-like isoform X2 [Rhodnius prolixus]|uniref:AN1-type zinc finger protein 1-like isoform X2 n=1 Tax=Rhodnius prolixus TaxID=13249 RepID=UPI003D18A7ED